MTPSIRIVAGLLLAPSLLVLPACSGDGDNSSAVAGSTRSAGLAAATKAPSTSPFAPTAPPAARPGEPQVVALPESDLEPIAGHAYAPIQGEPDMPATLRSLNEYFAGYVGRSLTRDGEVVAVVQLIRLQRDAASDEEFIDDFFTGFLQEFAETDKVGKAQIAGQKVRTVKDVRQTGAALVAWLDDRDLVMITSVDGLPAARQLAKRYLGAA